MAYDSYLPNNWWGSNSPLGAMAPAFGPNGAIPFDKRGLPTPGTAPAAAPTYTPPNFDYSQIGNIISQINAQGQQAQTAANNARIPGQPGLEGQSSNFISNLYGDANRAPGEMFANINTSAAERAVGGGFAGSPFGGVMGLKLNEDERLRRGGLAEGYHSAALARNPGYTPANPMAMLLQQQQQAYGGFQNQAERDLRERIANAQMANAALQNRRNVNAYNNRGYGPSIPTDYGRTGTGSGTPAAPSYTNIPQDPNRFGPTVLPPVSPNVSNLQNSGDLNRWQQDDYYRMLGQNPYYGMPDYNNPYSEDYSGGAIPLFGSDPNQGFDPSAMMSPAYAYGAPPDFAPPRFEPEVMDNY